MRHTVSATIHLQMRILGNQEDVSLALFRPDAILPAQERIPYDP